MKVTNLDTVLKDEKGEEMADGSTARKVLTAATAATVNPQVLQEDFDTKFKLGIVALKLNRAKRAVILTSEEIGLIKKRVGLFFSPMICVRLNGVLEGKNAESSIPADELDPPDDEKAA